MNHDEPEPDKRAVEITKEGFDLLCMWSRNIALLPLADWWDQMERFDSIGWVRNPTMYRDWLKSKNVPILRELIDKAMALKAVVMKAQPVIREIMREDEARKAAEPKPKPPKPVCICGTVWQISSTCPIHPK